MPATLPENNHLKEEVLTARLRRLNEVFVRALPKVCFQRARLVTKYSLDNGLFRKERISILDEARTYGYGLENRDATVRHSQAYKTGMRRFEFRDNQLFARPTTSRAGHQSPIPDTFINPEKEVYDQC